MGELELDYFPDKYEVAGRVYRTDEKKLYKNVASFASPSFDEIGAGGVPSGAIVMFGGINSEIPAGWLRCDGTSYTTASRPDLFAAIAYKWGGSGANFNVPDFETSNKFVRAADQDSEVAATGGESTHQLTTAELATHNHGISPNPHAHPAASQAPVAFGFGQFSGAGDPGSTGGASLSISPAGSNTAHENKPPYASTYYIIKE